MKNTIKTMAMGAMKLSLAAATVLCISTGKSNAQWSLTGNAGTTSSNFIGTTDAKDFTLKTNNSVQMTIKSNGMVGIGTGTTTPSGKLHVKTNNKSYCSLFENTYTTAGSTYAVKGSATGSGSGSKLGGYFEATGATGNNFGVKGYAGSGLGSTSVNYGVYGSTTSLGGNGYGVYGESNGGSGHYGVYGKSDYTGVRGWADGANVTTSIWGVYGQATGGTSGARYGVYGTASGGSNAWAGYFSGNTYASNLLVGTGTLTSGITVQINGDNEAVRVNGVDPYIQLQQSGVDKGYLRTIGNDLLLNTNAANNTGKIIFSANGNSTMYVHPDGNITIGTSTKATGYKVSVNGKVMCEELRVELSGNWPDYVFENNHQMKSIEEVDEYIQQNKHLPNIPSACEVEEKGLNVGAMQTKMTQQMEEMMLYIIQLKKENESLKIKMDSIAK